MEAIAAEAVKTIEGFARDPEIMAFVTNEARRKVESELNTNSGEVFDARMAAYIRAGLIGCYMAAVGVQS